MDSALIVRCRVAARRVFLWALIVAVVPGGAWADLRVCNWNLLQFSTSSVSGDQDRINAFRLVLSNIDPDILIVQEISNDNAVQLLRDDILNAPGGPGGAPGSPLHYVAASFTNTGDSLDIALLYRESKFTEGPGSYITLNTAPRHTPRWRMRPNEDPTGGSDLYIYAMHLASSNAGQRSAQTAAIRANANDLPAGTHIMYAGDFNIGSSNESSYQNFIGSQDDDDGRAFDPINSPGNWSNNPSFASIHTQSPNNDNDGAPGGAVGGGMDDRFDFMLLSASLLDGLDFDYVANSYVAYGQDGQHYNKDINDPPVIPEGIAVANALHASSDHLPIYLDLTTPLAQPGISLSPPSVLAFAPALVGGTSNGELTVTNTAPVPAQDLVYEFIETPDFLAPAGIFMEPAGGGGQVHVLQMDTSTFGNKVRSLQIANNSVDDSPIKSLLLTGAVYKHATPSTTASGQSLAGVLDFGVVDGQAVDVPARIYNADVAPFLTAPLAVTAASIQGVDADHFSLVGFAPIAGIETFADVMVRFDGAGAEPGLYSAELVFSTADDSDLPGATALADLTFALSAAVPVAVLGDFNLDGAVEPGDIPAMVALLLDPDAASPGHRWIGDMNQDEIINGDDLQLFIEALVP